MDMEVFQMLAHSDEDVVAVAHMQLLMMGVECHLITYHPGDGKDRRLVPAIAIPRKGSAYGCDENVLKRIAREKNMARRSYLSDVEFTYLKQKETSNV